MSVTNINTIPYNGGTIALHGVDITSVALSATKFVHFYAQATPNLIYAHVVNTTGLEGGTASSTNGPQFAFGASSTRIRAWKIAEGRLMVLIGSEMRVMEIAGDDTITMKAAKLTATDLGVQPQQWENSTGSSAFATDVLAGMSVGTYFKAISVVDNQLIAVVRSQRIMTIAQIFAINYNASTDVLTKANGASITIDNNGYKTPSFDFLFAKIPSSSNVVVYTVGTPNANFNYAYTNGVKPILQQAAIFNPTAGNFVRTFSVTGGENVTAIIATSETQLIGFVDGAAFKVHSGSTAATSSSLNAGGTGSWGSAVTFSTTGTNRVCTHAEMLNDSYILTTISDEVAPTVNGYSVRLGKQYMRIVRFVDTTFAEVIEANQNIAQSELGTPLNCDMPMVEKVGQYTFVFKSKANATVTDTKINLRSIFGGSE